jgi:Glycosyl transferases group 1
MRLLIATDAWRPQANGVVTTLTRMCMELPRLDVEVTLLTPERFSALPLPGYRTIRLALATFGLVLLEAMASGLPVAAYPVTGPIDVVEHGVSGMLEDDLAEAARAVLKLDSGAALARAASASRLHGILHPETLSIRPQSAVTCLSQKLHVRDSSTFLPLETCWHYRSALRPSRIATK